MPRPQGRPYPRSWKIIKSERNTNVMLPTESHVATTSMWWGISLRCQQADVGAPCAKPAALEECADLTYSAQPSQRPFAAIGN
jgi:hypothetical protein